MRYLAVICALFLAACGGSSSGTSQSTSPPPPPAPDTTAPVITLTGDNPQVIAFEDDYVELGATASDDRDGDVSGSVVVDASAVDTSTPGDYEVTYDVTDAAGNAADTVTRIVTVMPPVPENPVVSVSGATKRLVFDWTEPEYTEYYRLLENPTGNSGFTQIGDDIPAGTLTASREIAVHLMSWDRAQYLLEACNVTGCGRSDLVFVTDVMLHTIGYLKASSSSERLEFARHIALSGDGQTMAVNSNEGRVQVLQFDGNDWLEQTIISSTEPITGERIVALEIALDADGDTLAISEPGNRAVHVFRLTDDSWTWQAALPALSGEEFLIFGHTIDISDDGNTVAVGTYRESSKATGIDGDWSNTDKHNSGAAWVFRFDGMEWVQQAYFKASNTDIDDEFGWDVAISGDGNTLAVGAHRENSPSIGINGDQGNDPTGTANASGAVYLFRYDGADWFQQAYIKASNSNGGDLFGGGLDLNENGNTLAVSASGEDSNSTVINGDERNNGAESAGAAYVFRFDGTNWFQQAYLKTFNTESRDRLGSGWHGAVALSADGNTLAVGAPQEDSSAAGIDGDKRDNASSLAGAAYLFRFSNNAWQQRAYIKASNTEAEDFFGWKLAISAAGDTLVIGATREDSDATGTGGDQTDNSVADSGAVYTY